MGAVTIDPKIEPRILPLLSKGEQLLWAAKRQGPSSRQWKELWIALIVAGIVIAATTFWFGPYAVIWLVAINLLFHMPSVIWNSVAQWSYVFALTDQRVIFMRSLPPSNWLSVHLTDVNPHWVRFGEGKGIIQLAGKVTTRGPWNWWQARTIRAFIEGVPNLEDVRALILERAASAKPPNPELQRQQRKRHPVYG